MNNSLYIDVRDTVYPACTIFLLVSHFLNIFCVSVCVCRYLSLYEIFCFPSFHLRVWKLLIFPHSLHILKKISLLRPLQSLRFMWERRWWEKVFWSINIVTFLSDADRYVSILFDTFCTLIEREQGVCGWENQKTEHAQKTSFSGEPKTKFVFENNKYGVGS